MRSNRQSCLTFVKSINSKCSSESGQAQFNKSMRRSHLSGSTTGLLFAETFERFPILEHNVAIGFVANTWPLNRDSPLCITSSRLKNLFFLRGGHHRGRIGMFRTLCDLRRSKTVQKSTKFGNLACQIKDVLSKEKRENRYFTNTLLG